MQSVCVSSWLVILHNMLPLQPYVLLPPLFLLFNFVLFCFILFVQFIYFNLIIYFILLLSTNACPACQKKIHERHAPYSVILGSKSLQLPQLSKHYSLQPSHATKPSSAQPLLLWYVPPPSFPYLPLPRSLFLLLFLFSLPAIPFFLVFPILLSKN